MILVRAPLRISLGGGGTDLPSYSSRYGGFVVSAAIDKYVYIYANRPYNDDSVRLKYSKSEQVSRVSDLEHDLARISLEQFGVNYNIELAWMADVSEGAGLGSSGAFLVALVRALLELQKTPTTDYQVATHAYKIEGSLAGHPVGPQDHFVSAVGGAVVLTIKPEGRVEVETLGTDYDIRTGVEVEPLAVGLRLFEKHLLLFDTGIRRTSWDPLWLQKSDVERGDRLSLESLHRTKEMGYRARDLLLVGDVEGYGRLLHEHWEAKKLRRGITSPVINGWYQIAMECGAWGGKIVGAGGGGFLLFAAPMERHLFLIEKLSGYYGLRQLPFTFASRGVEVVAKG